MKGTLKKCRGSRPEVFCKKRVLKNFAKLTGKHPCESLLFKEKHLCESLLSKNTS